MKRINPSRLIPGPILERLELQMGEFYDHITHYPSFAVSSHHPLEWQHLLNEVRRRNAGGGEGREPVAILEFGCGRSGFPSWLRQQLGSDATALVTITCQDVTATNQAYLQQVADQVLIAPLAEGVLPPGSFDLIFSTHCFEHVARPEALLRTCISLLKPGGALLLFAPRYDLPFYLSPSCVNLPPVSRLLLGLRLLMIRLLSVLRGRPAFLIDTNPACLDRPFVRDADAIHWVSAHDLRLFARRNGLEYSLLDVRHRASFLSKQGVIDAFCKLAVQLQKVALLNP
ncbi:class I SAM-dependent methyltransferase [Cyanobium sp. FGCU-6]|nr:class I SAM-dependent methyltransferase [Cyanobium sp. FGCU6]